ncbi:MAG: AAA family ATPase, partial [Myxococcota bacterium]
RAEPPGTTGGAAAARARPHPLLPARPARDDGTQLISWPDLRTGRRDTSGDTEVLDQTALQRSVPLIGRDAVLAEILAGAERALAGRAPTLCTVVAEPGFGKSHVCAELRARLREPDEDGERVGGADDTQPWVIALRARAPVAGGRRHTVRELLMQLLDLPAELPEVGFAPLFARRLGAELADALGVSLALALGWLSADSPQARGLAVAPGALRTAAARATSAVLRHLAERRPLAILIDDAHAADQVTLDALELATLAEGGAAIWVCVLARPSLDRIRPEWGRRSAASPRFDLGPLDTEAAAALCRCLLQPIERIPALAIDRLVARTQGIPLLMVELVRGLRAEGLVRQHESGAPYIATDEIERLPDVPVLEWLAGRELEALPAELASHAYLIALMNGDVTGLEVIGVLAEIDSAGHIAHFPLDPMVATRRLLDASLLVMHRDGRFGFRSDVLRDTVARSAPDQLPQVVHQAAFRFYRASTALHPLTRLARLAFHAERAGVHQQAVRTYLDLAERATTRHDYLEAEILYTRVLDALARNDSRDDARDDSRDDARDDSRHDARDLASDRRAQDSADADEGRHRDRSRRMAAHRGRGLMRYRLGRYQDSLSDFASARVLAAELGEEAAEIEILLDEATALDWCDEWQTSAQRTEEARRLAGQLFNAQIEARLLMAEGRSLWRQNRNRAAFDLLDQAESLAERMGDEAYETFVISLLVCGYLKVVLGDFEHAEHRFGRVIPLCQERGDMMHLAAALGNRAFLWIAKNDIERMLDDQRKLLELSRELGNARMEQHANFYLGQYLLWTGEVAKAKGHAQRARDIDEHRLANTARQESALLVARVLAASGDRSEARRALEWIRSRREQATLRSGSDPELVPLEEAQFAMVDLAIRDDYDEGAWDELEAEVETLASGRERLELLELRALSAVHCDRVDDARQVLKRAATIAADIPDVLGEQR